MGIFFKDEFAGSGPLAGRVPDIGFSENDYWYEWGSSPALVVSGGYIDNSANLGIKTAAYGDYYPGDNPPEFTLDFTFVTPPTTAPGLVRSYLGFNLELHLDDADYPSDSLAVYVDVTDGPDGPTWEVYFECGYELSVENIATPEGSTAYPVRITVAAESTTLSIFGVTYSLSIVRGALAGLQSMSLALGDSCKAGNMVAASLGDLDLPGEDEEGIGNADLTAPAAQMHATGGEPRVSPIFFSDEFHGSGPVTGHAPEIGLDVFTTWRESVRNTNLVGGYAVNPNYSGSKIRYSPDENTFQPAEFTIDFTYVTGPSVDVDEVDALGFRIETSLDEPSPFGRLSVQLYAAYDEDLDSYSWELSLYDDSGHLVSATITTLEASTEYDGTITSSATGSTITIFGVTLVLPTPRPLRGGVTAFELSIGGYSKIGQLVGRVFDGAPSPEEGIGIADLTAPMALLSAGDGAKGAAALSAPSASIEAAGRDSTGDQSFTYTAPAPVLQAFGGAQARLAAPRAALSLTGTVSGQGRAALAPPAPLIEADGRVSGTAGAAVRAPASRLVGYGGAVCSITVAGATLQASGTSGAIGRAALALPLFQLTASGSRQNHGRAELLAPAARLGAQAQAWLLAPAARLTAIGTAVVAVSYEAYSVNLSHGDPEATHEVTHYTHFPFDRIVRYQGSYFGVAADGLYLLEGTTDDGDAIGYAVKTCVDDFKASELKTIDAACFAGRLGAASTVTLLAGETGAAAYDFTTPRGPAAQNHRQRFGKGVKSRYFALALAGDDTFELDAIELDVRKLKRRI